VGEPRRNGQTQTTRSGMRQPHEMLPRQRHKPKSKRAHYAWVLPKVCAKRIHTSLL
jgi:hypothetical protein